MEKWKSIIGFENYLVSSHGRVKNKEGKILKPQKVIRKNRPNTKKNYYLSVDLCNKGKVKRHKIHRLIATSFVGLPTKEKNCVNHIDGNGSNNRPENLEWVTHKENMKHAAREGFYKKGVFHHNSKLEESDIKIIRFLKGLLSQKEVSEIFNVDRSLIGRIQNNKRHTQ